MAAKRTALIAVAWLATWLAVAAAPAQAQSGGAPTPAPSGLAAPQFAPDKPIQVQANRLEADNEEGVLRLEGNVVARQDQTTLNADIVLIYYKPGGAKTADQAGGTTAPHGAPTATAPGAVGGGPLAGGGGIERLIALGRVQIAEGDRKATAERVEYDQNKNTITLSGDPVVAQGDNVLRGSVIVVNTATKMVNVRGSRSERVNVTIMPRSAQQAIEQQKKNAADKKDSDTNGGQGGGKAAGPGAPDAGDGAGRQSTD